MVIGVDFDNTLVSYDALIYEVARQRGLVGAEVAPSKRAVRDAIRRSPEGDRAWHGVQTVVYGERMEEARLIDGVAPFMARCHAVGSKVCIISHKTERPSLGADGPDFRAAAVAWMRRRRFFEADGLGLAESDVSFEPTRADKVRRIGLMGCTHFIDDLEETFLESGFPSGVAKILYAPHGQSVSPSGVKALASWQEISDALFG